MDELSEIPLEFETEIARWTSDFARVARADPSLAADETRLLAWFAMVYLDGRTSGMDQLLVILGARREGAHRMYLRFAAATVFWAASVVILFILLFAHA